MWRRHDIYYPGEYVVLDGCRIHSPKPYDLGLGSLESMRVLALDPGGTSGLAMAHWEAGFLISFRSWELPALEAVRDVHVFIREKMYGPDRAVVCEAWTPRPGVKTFQPEALESIGAVRFLCWRYDINFGLQYATDAKNFSTNEKLKKMDWRRPSPGGHRDDAARHLLLCAVQLGLVDPAVFL